jgi:cytoskeletal protein RodZ
VTYENKKIPLFYIGGEKIDNKIIAAIIIVLLIVVGAVYVFETQNSSTPINNTTNTSTNDTITQSNATTSTQNTTTNTKKATNTTNNNPHVKISAAEAKKLVEQNGQDGGVPSSYKAGTPTLIKVAGEYYWKVPYFGGYMYVNVNTGDVDALL